MPSYYTTTNVYDPGISTTAVPEFKAESVLSVVPDDVNIFDKFSNFSGSESLGFGVPNTATSRRIIHYSFGTVLILIGIAGTMGNSLVLYVFTRYRRLRGGGGRLILSLALGDLMVSVFHFMPAYSSFRETWMFGTLGCDLYAALVGLGGMASLLTLAMIAADRFSVIMGNPCPWMSGKKMCVCIWLFCMALVVPPFFGWSRFQHEGLNTSCSWDYSTRTWSNRAYYIFLLFFGFVVPVSLIVVSYIGILRVVWSHSSQMQGVTRNGVVHHNKKTPSKSDIKTAQIIFTIIICFLASWTPYAVISMIGQFGDVSLLTPLATSLPAVFAKASVLYNPIVYGLSHPHFRSVLRTIKARTFSKTSNPCKNSPRHDNDLQSPKGLYDRSNRPRRYIIRKPRPLIDRNLLHLAVNPRAKPSGGLHGGQPATCASDPVTYRTIDSEGDVVKVYKSGWSVLKKRQYATFTWDFPKVESKVTGASDGTAKSVVELDEVVSDHPPPHEYQLDCEMHLESSSTHSEPELLRSDSNIDNEMAIVKLSYSDSHSKIRKGRGGGYRRFLFHKTQQFFRSEECIDELNFSRRKQAFAGSQQSQQQPSVEINDEEMCGFHKGIPAIGSTYTDSPEEAKRQRKERFSCGTTRAAKSHHHEFSRTNWRQMHCRQCSTGEEKHETGRSGGSNSKRKSKGEAEATAGSSSGEYQFRVLRNAHHLSSISSSNSAKEQQPAFTESAQGVEKCCSESTNRRNKFGFGETGTGGSCVSIGTIDEVKDGGKQGERQGGEQWNSRRKRTEQTVVMMMESDKQLQPKEAKVEQCTSSKSMLSISATKFDEESNGSKVESELFYSCG